MTQNQQVLIDTLPQGKLEASHYRLETNPAPAPGEDEVLVKTIAFAITAGTRAGLQGSASYAGAPQTGIVMNGTGVGEVFAPARQGEVQQLSHDRGQDCGDYGYHDHDDLCPAARTLA